MIAALAAAVALATPSPAPAPTPDPIHLRGHFVGEAAANPSGGLQRGTAFASEFMLGADVDFAKLTGAGGTLHITFTMREGSSLSANTLGNIFTVQEFGGDGLTPRPTEFSYEQAFAKGKVVAIAGRVITENDFAVSPVYWGDSLYCTFQNNGICGTPISILDQQRVRCLSASARRGCARVKVMPTSNFYVETGAYQVNPSYGLRGHGFDLSTTGDSGTYYPLELGFKLNDYNGTSMGNIRIGGYYDTSSGFGVQNQITRFVAPNSPAIAMLPNVPYAGRWGYWLQADHLLSGSAKKHERGIAAFASLIYGEILEPHCLVSSAMLRHRRARHVPRPRRRHGLARLRIRQRQSGAPHVRIVADRVGHSRPTQRPRARHRTQLRLASSSKRHTAFGITIRHRSERQSTNPERCCRRIASDRRSGVLKGKYVLRAFF